MSALWFVCALAAIVLLGWSVKRRTGSRTWTLDDWVYTDGEHVVWRDDDADIAKIPMLGKAVFTSPARLHRWQVVATNERVILAEKAFGGKHIVMMVLQPGRAASADSKKIGGGLFTTGYETIVVLPGDVTRHVEEGYLVVKPDPAEPSSANLAEIRIYTERAETFRLPSP
jgi:hypothetical protein